MKTFALNNPSLEFDETVFASDLASVKERGLHQAFTRRRVVFYMDGYRYAHDAAQKRWGIDFIFYETGREPVKRVFQSQDLNEKAANLWTLRMRQDPKFGHDLVEELLEIIRTEKTLVEDVTKLSLTPESAAESLKRHLSWWISFFELAFLWFAADPIKSDTDARIRAGWQGKPEELEHLLEHVYRPMRLPLSSLEQRELLKLAQLKGEELEGALHAHQKKFGHLALHVLDDEPFDVDYYRSRVVALQDPAEYARQQELLGAADREMEAAGNLLADAPIAEELKRQVEFVRWFMYLRTESIDHMMLVNGAYKKVFSFLSERFGLTVEEVLHLTYKEIIDGLERGLSIQNRERARTRAKDGYAYFIGTERAVLVTGSDIDRIEQACFPEKQHEQVTELTGQVAYKGLARGRVRVILDRKAANTVKEGEILVTTMTSPEYVPAMKRAAGIVTNEGGVLCHAAIMSRELRKPCVIGTKNATEVFKDGDLVEVDAEKGIIQLIS